MPETLDATEAVGAAALFALVLELQGRDETTITRLLDAILRDDEPPPIDSAAKARDWLDNVRSRFGVAMAAEVTR
jgi:hypothetical protein